MQLGAGSFIKSTELLAGTYFAEVTILLTEFNDAGAAGFVLNRPFGRSLHELEAYRHSPYFPLFEGGPVDCEHLYLLHRRPDLVADSVLVGNGIYFGGNMQRAVTAINNRNLTTSDIKILVGYCGWDAGELEDEIAEGSWMIMEGGEETVFS